jgi:predicted transposase/invertase (TIGR01784 family)
MPSDPPAPSSESSRSAKAKAAQPHDGLFKACFSEPKQTASLLRSVLPPEVLAKTDLSSLKLEDGQFVDEVLRGSESDLLFSVTVAGCPGFAYVLFEHLSSPQRLVQVRLLGYMARIWLKFSIGSAEPLAPILPVVVFHHASGWRGSLEFRELFDPAIAADPAFRRYLPSFAIAVDDISRQSDQELKSRALETFAVLVLWVFRDAREPGRIRERLDQWAETLTDLLNAPSGFEAARQLFAYILANAKEGEEVELHKRVAQLSQAAETAFVTAAEALHRRGLLEGRDAGQREILLTQLTERFGPLSAETRSKLDAARSAELLQWSKRILSADTLDAVFRE